MQKGKTVLLGVSGGIAAYRAADLASILVKQGFAVPVIMTEHAREFISPLTFEALTGQRCITDTFDRNFSFDVEHVSLAKQADMAVVAPATANVIGKLANGIADDMLTTTMLACTCPKLIVPAMNTAMYENSIVQENLTKLSKHGHTVMEPAVGRLACGDVGAGKFPPNEDILGYILKEIAMEKDMAGIRVLVTAGPTREAVDPVRFLSNRSSGKMGYAIARDAMLRGADVTLVTGHTHIAPPPFAEVVRTESAAEMFEAVKERFRGQDVVVMCAAVADYTPGKPADEKIKKGGGDMAVALKRTADILQYLGEHKEPGTYVCGFSMETENVLENSRKKLLKKNADMIAANSLREAGAGFAGDTNKVALITREREEALPLMSKEETAHALMSAILAERAADRQNEKRRGTES